MFKFEIKLDGKSIRPEDFGKALEADIKKFAVEAARKNIDSKVRGLRCPVHGSSPQQSPTREGVNLSLCCEKLKELVDRAMKP